MNREITKKWQKKVKELEEAVMLKTMAFSSVDTENVKLKAKLERFEQRESSNVNGVAMEVRKLEDQVIWLRELVEQLTISPQMFHAVTTRQIRHRDQANKESLAREAEWNRQALSRQAIKSKVVGEGTEIRG